MNTQTIEKITTREPRQFFDKYVSMTIQQEIVQFIVDGCENSDNLVKETYEYPQYHDHYLRKDTS